MEFPNGVVRHSLFSGLLDPAKKSESAAR